jgi:hypothetical protein
LHQVREGKCEPGTLERFDALRQEVERRRVTFSARRHVINDGCVCQATICWLSAFVAGTSGHPWKVSCEVGIVRCSG